MAKAKKDMTPKERREQLIKDRAARLARDAKKQGMTPAQLMKKKTDTYVNVVGGAALGALPVAAVLRNAGTLFKGLAGGAKKTKTATKALPKKSTSTALTKPRNTSVASKKRAEASRLKSRAESKSTAVASRPSTAVKPKSKAVGPRKPKAAATDKGRIVGLSNKGKAVVAGTAALTAATLLSGKGEKKAEAKTPSGPKPRPSRKTTPTGPKPRPKRSTGMSEGNTVAGSSGRRASKGPGVGRSDKNDPRKGFSSKPTAGAKKAAPKKVATTKSRDKDGQGTGKIGLPAGAKRKFSGGYNSKTEKLRNIGGKTYVFNK